MISNAHGFTLIELMIVVAIIAIMAAIAIPQYRHYTQKSANNACLAEATAYVSQSMSLIVSDRAADVTDPPHKACESGLAVTESDYNNGATLIYVPRLRGSIGDIRNTQCNTGSRSCNLTP